jgi:hypothetical protein
MKGSNRRQPNRFSRHRSVNAVTNPEGLGPGVMERMQAKTRIRGDVLSVSKIQRRAPALALDVITKQQADRNAAISAAYATGAYSYRGVEWPRHLRIQPRYTRTDGNAGTDRRKDHGPTAD